MLTKLCILRASVQTLSIIDAAVTTLLLITVIFMGIVVPTFKPPGMLSAPPTASGRLIGGFLHINIIPPTPPAPPPENNTFDKDIIGGSGNPNCFYYNSTDVYWWHYTNFQTYTKSLRKLGNVLDATFCFLLFVVVVADVILVKGIDETTDPTRTPRFIWYWLMCNTGVIMMLPVLAVFSIQIAGRTGVLQECGLGCGLPYFYIIYRLLFGFMVVLYLWNHVARLEEKQMMSKKAGKPFFNGLNI